MRLRQEEKGLAAILSSKMLMVILHFDLLSPNFVAGLMDSLRLAPAPEGCRVLRIYSATHSNNY